ncbi:LamG-like jellyroll fold domain-containing protein [Plantactinospora sp. CA-290183]|uniref:LamG-like jellyroll fold domain-containing protein n=1 Tax=Plantactinospora sp. CA-290183 TaxID=3240006 RepID=UPI003D8FDAF4
MTTHPSTRRRRITALATVAILAAIPIPDAARAAPPSPADTGWTKGTPPLATPWTDDVSPDNALPEYPRPQLTRTRWQNLNGVWEFAAAAPDEAVPVGEELPERVLVPYPIESALSGIQRHEDRMWYRRTFTVPPDWQVGSDQRLLLHFGAVDYDSKVWVNGEQVATHRGGYDGFSADVTDALRPDGAQELIVWAEDLTDATFQPVGKQRRVGDRGIFYQGSSGIWQTVWMEPVAAAGAVDSLDMTPDLGDKTLRLRVNPTAGAAGLTVEAVAYDGRRALGRVTGAVGTELSLPIRTPKLWSPDTPFLYDLRVRLLDGRRPVDEVGSYFGMREIGKAEGADGKLRLTLNGEILFHMSTLDQGFWPDGLNTAPTDEALRFDLEQHKVLGFNTVRKHIKVEPARWYYWADRLGLLVWQDMPSTKTGRPPVEWQRQWESELHEMIAEHDNITSIVVWVPFNEGWGEWSREATGRIADELRARDPGRLVNAHSGVNCCDSLGDSGRGDIIDHHQYLGPAAPIPRGDRVAVDGEHGGIGLEVEGHMWFGEGGAYEMVPDSATLTQRYVENQRALLGIANTCGVSAGVYTQITDVEHEVNGFFTYDRQVEKMDFDQVRAINQEIIRSADGTGEPTPEPPPGTPGLAGVGYWPLDENTGTTAGDAAGENDGTLVNGPTWTPGRSGAALAFNGTDQYVDTGRTILDTTASYSASAWVKLDSVGGAFQTVVSQDGPSASAFFLQYSGQNRRFAMSFAGVRALAPTEPVAGQWYHLAGVRDAATGELRLYVDGELAGQVDACLGTASTGPLVIGRGRFDSKPVDYLDGTIDQVHVYDRALSATEVKALYDSGQ